MRTLNCCGAVVAESLPAWRWFLTERCACFFFALGGALAISAMYCVAVDGWFGQPFTTAPLTPHWFELGLACGKGAICSFAVTGVSYGAARFINGGH